jgi:GntR family transcriptional regulator of gluconate operon
VIFKVLIGGFFVSEMSEYGATIKTALPSKIANMLRREIYENTLKAGDHLNETQIANRMGVSRGPVRDALRILESEGLVDTPPNGRTVVLGFSIREIADYYDLRYHLESEAITKIILSENNSSYKSWLKNLEQLVSDSRVYLEMNNEEMFSIADFEFHLALLNQAGNRISVQVWKMLANMSRTIMEMNKRYLSNLQLHNIQDTFAYHDRILIGLKTRNLEMALESLKQHLMKGTETYALIMEQVSDMKGHTGFEMRRN